jgi:hypothetical protein
MPAKPSKRLNARVPAEVAADLDFVVRNTETDGITNTSTAIVAALRSFNKAEIAKIKTRGVEVPKGY